MKKIVAMLLSLCMVFACPVNKMLVSAAENYDESWNTLKALNLIKFTDEQKNENITRAEFADMLANDLNLNVGTYNGNNQQVSEFKDDEKIFSDVSSSDQYFEAIKAVCEYGIMKGDTDGNFYPNKGLKYEEAVKTFISVLGYDTEALIKGGWFIGYNKVAEKLKITLPDVNTGKILSKAELTEMFFRAFHVEVNEVEQILKGSIYYKANEDKTFLSECLNIGFAEGQVTAVENSSLTSKNTSASNSITVDEKEIKNPNKIYTNEYLGRIAKAYYNLNNNKNTLMYITYSDLDSVISIKPNDFAGYKNGVITYYSGSRKKNVNVSSYPVIYNGTALPTYDESIFDIEYGSITITDNDYENVVIVREYTDMVISAMSEKDNTVYDENTGKSISFDEDTYNVYITDASNKPISFEDVKYGMSISVIDGENYKELHINEPVIKGTINSVNYESRRVTVSEKEYGMSKDAADSLKNMSLQKDVQVYVNVFGEIFYIKSSGNNMASGILANVGYDGFYEQAKIFGDDGKFYTYYFDKNVKVYVANSASYITANKDFDSAGVLNGYRGYISYKLSGDKIKEIQIPLESKTLKQDGDSRITLKEVSIGATNFWNYDKKSIGNDIFFDASVKLYSVPSNTKSYDDYEIINYNDVSSYEMFSGKVEAYFSDFDDPIPDAVVVKDFRIENSHIRILDNMSVIKELTSQIDENGDIIKTAVVVNANNDQATVFSKETAIDKNGNPCTLFDAAQNFADGEKVKLEVGDIIIYNTKYGTNELSRVRAIYDCDKVNMPGGKKGYLSAAVTGTDMYYALNSSFNIMREWNPYKYSTVSDMVSGLYITGTLLTRQNPIRIHSGIVRDNNIIEILGTDGHASFGGGYQIMLGYVTDNTDAFVHLTTQDLSVPGAVYKEDGMPDVQIPNPAVTTPDNYTGFYHQEYYKYVISNGYILLIEYNNKGINIRKATPNDILSYKEAGADASRILAYPELNRYFIINDYRTR